MNKEVTTHQALKPLASMKPKEQISYLLNQRKGELAKMLPKTLSIERLLKVAQIAATTTPSLAKCDVASLVGAIGQCAQMGLEPNTVLGHAYLVPFNTKRKDANGVERWVNSVQVIVGYKGFIDLARRSGQIISIAAHEVCEYDKFELSYGLDEKLNHTPSMTERGEVIGFYAVAKLKDGGHCFEFMSRQQVEQIQAFANSKSKFPSAVWRDHFVEMGRKTVIRRLSKYLPLSIEFQTAAALDGMAEAGKDQNNETIDGEFTIISDDGYSQGVDQSTGEITRPAPPVAPPKPALPNYTDEQFSKSLPMWRGLIESGKKSADEIIATVSTKALLSEEQAAMIYATVVQEEEVGVEGEQA